MSANEYVALTTFDGEPNNTSDEDDNPSHYTADNAVEKIGFGWFQIKIMAVVGIFSAADACEMLLLAVLSPVLNCEWRLQEWQVALITTVVFLGMFSTAPIWGSWCDKYGRWPIMVLVSSWIFFYGILTSMSPTYWWVLGMRMMVGVGIAGGSFAFTYLTEYIPFKWRSKMLTVHQVFWALGSVLEILLAYLVVRQWGWRWFVALSSIPLGVAVITIYCCIPESVRYLVTAGRKEEAVSVLKDAARINGTSIPDGELIGTKVKTRGTIWDLISPEYRCTSMCLTMVWFTAAFSYYGMVLTSSEIEKFQSHCAVPPPAVSQGNHTIQKYQCSLNCHELADDDYITMIISALGEFISIPINFVLLDYIGRKYTLAVNCSLAGIGFMSLQICSSRAVLSGISMVIRSFCTGTFLATYIYTSEVYPTTVRSLGLGINSSFARIGAMVTPFVAQVLLNSSPHITAFLYGGVCILTAVIACLLPIETKGREMPQTVSMYEIPMPDGR
ncbi:synaptic vesicle 2-related protein-like isoform X2 [Tubulanus polymorphus]|uniref:synaptic vesicle 2-related protein-like isoform X2 n=1 Tax=Tubulanus polymorphus TaxID=672921 RepID=UPI003DA438E4